MEFSKDEKGFKLRIEHEKKEYNANYQPFRNIFDGVTEISGKDVSGYEAKVEYKKREGGTYIYSNNPEMLAKEDVGQAILRTENLTGNIFFTYEHSNRTGDECYFGYQIKNDGESEVTVKIKNLGFQIDGEWLGQRSWSDFYGAEFSLPFDYFLDNGEVNPIYVGCDYVKYKPERHEAEEYKIPAGEYIYVLGGTSEDAYKHINVFGTADKKIKFGKCSNAAVYFEVSGGSVTGTFYCYTDASQVKAEPKRQGFITTRVNSEGKEILYGKQYKGVDYSAGLIEAKIDFIVDDDTKSGKLPVFYEKRVDEDYKSKNAPYQKYDLKTKVLHRDSWLVALNPISVGDAIGEDMMVFNDYDVNGNPVCIEPWRADFDGEPANIGNWMVQYTDNFTFVNVGKKDRKFRIFKKGNGGVLFSMTRNEEGEILSTYCNCNPYHFGSEKEIFDGVDRSLLAEKNGRLYFKVADGRPYCDVVDERALCYEITVKAGGFERISVDYNILGNSYGGTRSWVEVE